MLVKIKEEVENGTWYVEDPNERRKNKKRLTKTISDNLKGLNCNIFFSYYKEYKFNF